MARARKMKIQPLSVTLVALASLASCSDTRPPSPTSPTPQPSVPPVAMRTITGTMWLHSPTGSQPLAGHRAGIWLEQPTSARPAGGVTSDSAGRFTLDVPADALVRLYTRTSELFQPCLSTVPVDRTDATIRVVAVPHLLDARNWPAFGAEQRSGTVFEITPAGRRPSADAWVQVDGVYGDGRPLADTRTDEHGRFVVCGIEDHPWHALVVAKPGYHLAYAKIPAAGAGAVDIELRECAGAPTLAPGWCF